MKTLTTLLLTLGLCALSLPAFAGPSCDATGEGELNVMDIVAIVSAVLGTSEDEVNCAGPGCDVTSNDAEVAADAVASVDITSDNADAIAAAMPACDFEGGEVWDGSTCATPESSDPAPNCFLMGLCGQDGAAQYGVDGPYSQMSIDDAVTGDGDCVGDYQAGVEVSSGVYWPGWYGSMVAHACD